MGEKVKGKLIIIGGGEDKKGKCVILRTVAELMGGESASLVIVTTATLKSEAVEKEYIRIFKHLGIKEVKPVNIDSREKAAEQKIIDIIKEATGIFFTGGDQLRITSLLGGTPVYEALYRCYESGVVIAGTSAGASAMSDNMIVEGKSDDSPKKDAVNMAPGMGFLEEVVIDQHFAQRGRIGRLLDAVARNPYILGVGIDEDTAIIVEPEGIFRVVGSRTVIVIDGRGITFTNVSELNENEPLALTDICLHVLPSGFSFDLKKRRPLIPG